MMELIKRLFLNFVKGVVLLIGIAMLVGGGLCSVSIPLFGTAKETAVLIGVALVALMVVGLLIFLTLKQRFSEQIKYLVLLISGLFLVGGGLCSTNRSSTQIALSGLLLIDIAVTLCGYILIRWILASWKKASP